MVTKLYFSYNVSSIVFLAFQAMILLGRVCYETFCLFIGVYLNIHLWYFSQGDLLKIIVVRLKGDESMTRRKDN